MNQRRCRLMAVPLLMIGVFLMVSAEGSAQESQDSSTIVWWVVGTGGILNAGNDDGDTLSATLGQTGIDSTTVDDSTYGKLIAAGFMQPRPTAWLGFWLPRYTRLDEQPPTTGGTANTFALTNHPNPFSERTTISYLLPGDGKVRLEIFDATGRRVRLLVNEAASAGAYRVVWDGTDDAGRVLASGAYLYRIELTSGTSRRAEEILHLRR